jgi:D-glycero-D-manno-heptose 1,7-bisphosphate phosphatase
MRGAIFFDRDRTLIADAPPGAVSVSAQRPEHVRLLPRAIEALRAARDAGYLLVVVTNQPGAAKSECTRQALEATNDRFRALLVEAGAPLDGLFTCFHHPIGAPGGDRDLVRACDCRKPEPGLLLEATRALGVDLSRAAIVGDRDSDLAAGRALGLPGALVDDALHIDVLDATRDVLAALSERARMSSQSTPSAPPRA